MNHILLSPQQREWLESSLLTCDQWQERANSMPPECRNVATGAVSYCGCEGIGHTEKTGWYLVLWEPSELSDPGQSEPIGDSGLTLLRAEICPNSGPSTVSLLFIEKPEAMRYDFTIERGE